MSNTKTLTMLALYEQMASATLFFTGLFRTPAENFYTSEEVEVDILRSEEDVSIVIQDVSTGPRFNAEDLYTNKRFKAPVHDEAIALNSFDLLKRMPGQNPFVAPDFRANVIVRALRGMTKAERKIRRAIELQAAQVLQTGTVDLKDSAGATLYTIDYKPKATHFPTASIAWDNASSTKLADLEALGNVIRADGLVRPMRLIFGDNALNLFFADEAVQARLDNRRMELGQIAPVMRGEGATFQGTIQIGNYRYEIWSYSGRYKDPQTGVSTPYMDPNKVVMLSDDSRLDGTFGAIPNIGREMGANGAMLLPELPTRFSMPNGAIDLHPNVWLSPDGKNLFGSVAARPLMIPTGIDTYGCLDINV